MYKRKHKNYQNSASVGGSSVYFEKLVPRSVPLALLSSGAKFAVSKILLVNNILICFLFSLIFMHLLPQIDNELMKCYHYFSVFFGNKFTDVSKINTTKKGKSLHFLVRSVATDARGEIKNINLRSEQ